MLRRVPEPLQARQPRQRGSGDKVRTIYARRRPRSRLREPAVRAAHAGGHQDPDCRGAQASVHDQGQRIAAVDVGDLLPHYLAPQGGL